MAAFDTILFVGRSGIDFYFNGNILTFPFAPNFFKDIEILDPDIFKTGLDSFLNKNGMSFGTCAIVLSDSVCFISEVIPKTQNQESALGVFLGNLPFDNPAARILGNKIVGTNKDLYQEIMNVIGPRGARVKMISPVFLSKEMVGKKKLDDEVVDFISKNEDVLFKSTFIYEAPMPQRANPEAKPQKRSRRELILIGVFILLFVGVAIWVLTRLL